MFAKKYTWIYLALLSLPIIALYGLTIFSHPFAVSVGDGDSFYAMSEAARKIILQYGQFPWWNPWIAGGIPLFADPQFGLFSIHMVIILLFGSALGWKISLVIYLLIGFYGLRKLLLDVVKTPELTATLLAFTWAVSWFWMARAAMGHYTFFIICFLPWLLILYFRRDNIKYSWMKLGLLIALMINTAFHYFTVISLLIFGIFVIGDLVATIAKKPAQSSLKNRLLPIRPIGYFFLLVSIIAIPLSAMKLYAVIVLNGDYERVGKLLHEPFSGLNSIFDAMFGLHFPNGNLLNSGFSPLEATTGIGIGVFVILIFIASSIFWNKANQKRRSLHLPFSSNAFLITLLILFVLLACGNFMPGSPFGILRHLPFFNQTRLAVRWLIPAGFICLLLIANYKYKNRYDYTFVNGILAINITYLAIVGGAFAGANHIDTARADPIVP